MSSTPPPSPEPAVAHRAERRPARPRYLIVALAFALVFGAGCWTEGCSRLAFYRGDQDHGNSMNAAIHDDADRAHAESLFQRFVDAANAERGRAIPIAAATFVLGAALLALAARGLAGRSNARSAIMQVVAAQAIVVGASYFATQTMRNAEADWEYESVLIHQHEQMPPDQYAQAVPTIRALRRWCPPAWLGFRTFASLLIVLALARPRSKEYFEAAAGAVPDP